MPGEHQGGKKKFSELNFAEQAKSITATINVLQSEIAYHIKHSPQRVKTTDKCKAQIERLQQRLLAKYP